MKIVRNILILATLALLTSCGASKKVAYFQDLSDGMTEEVLNDLEIRLRPGDKISIMVNSKDPALSNLFNLPYSPRRIGEVNSSFATGTSYNQGVLGYTIDERGQIDFPVLGLIDVTGRTRDEVAKYIKDKLTKGNLVKDPVVTVDYMNLTVSVLGEVAKPGRFAIDKDRITILDALSMAGDMTIQGRRENVKVIREVGDERKVFEIDLNSGYQLYASPAYCLQQNDIVYVEPNKRKARETTVNGNTVQSASFWVSIATALVSITSTIVTLVVVTTKG